MAGVEVLIPLVGTISVFGCLGFILYVFLRTRHKERMALIESGTDASIFKRSRNIHANLKWGMLGVAIGIALFLGHFLEEYTSMDDGAGYFPLIFFLGGVALLIYYQRAKHDHIEEEI